MSNATPGTCQKKCAPDKSENSAPISCIINQVKCSSRPFTLKAQFLRHVQSTCSVPISPKRRLKCPSFHHCTMIRVISKDLYDGPFKSTPFLGDSKYGSCCPRESSPHSSRIFRKIYVSSIRQYEGRLGEMRVLFVSSIQTGPFFIIKKRFFKLDWEKEQRRQWGKTPEKGLINVDLIFDHLLRARSNVALILLLWLYFQRDSCAMTEVQRKLGNVAINNIAIYNCFNSAVYMISQSAHWHSWNIHRYLALPNIITVCFH